MDARSGKHSRKQFGARGAAHWASRVFLALIALAFFDNPPASELLGAAASLESGVKAAFLFNFTKFVDWPSSVFATADAPLTICILGGDPFGRVIDQIVEGESVNGHPIAVERIQTDQQKSCQVLYVGDNRALLTTWNATRPAVLTVGEGEDFIRHGGVIGFVIDNRRVRFDINLKAAANNGLKLSSKLLSVARSVER